MAKKTFEVVEITTAQACGLMGITKARLSQIAREDKNFPKRFTRTTFRADDFGRWIESRIKGTGEINFHAERARLTQAQANEKELQVEVLRGNLIPQEEVEKTWASMIANARAKLLTMPNKLAKAAFAATGLQEVEENTRALIHEALYELADDECR